ncbi:MAG: hypothetical protein RL095_3714 [Verrucomicrobiota bacterium]
MKLRLSILALYLACVAAGLWQNAVPGRLGGAISIPKILWLATALSAFFLVPPLILREQPLAPRARRLLQVFWASWLLRAPLEAALLLGWAGGWRCVYGISHDLACLALVMAALATRPAPALRSWLFWLAAVLCCEASFAWLFSLLIDPRSGVWFADASAAFARINLGTAACLALLLPWLAWNLRTPLHQTPDVTDARR